MRKTQIIVITILLAFLGIFQNAFGAVKSRTAISPYIQTDADSTYTFVGITHPSLNTANTQIGFTIASTGLSTDFSSSLTITSGQTYRIFIVSTNHSTINSLTVTGDRVVFLGTTNGSSEAGNLLFTSSSTDPSVASNDTNPGSFRLEDLGQLSMWGAIVIPSTSTGFAMEFVGDAHDSASLVTSEVSRAKNDGAKGTRFNEGRGIR